MSSVLGAARGPDHRVLPPYAAKAFDESTHAEADRTLMGGSLLRGLPSTATGIRCSMPRRGSPVAGGARMTEPDLAAECNRTDLPRVSGVDLVGAVPEGAGRWDRERFTAAATWFDQIGRAHV
jgi:hypothetical protein